MTDDAPVYLTTTEALQNTVLDLLTRVETLETTLAGLTTTPCSTEKPAA